MAATSIPGSCKTDIAYLTTCVPNNGISRDSGGAESAVLESMLIRALVC